MEGTNQHFPEYIFSQSNTEFDVSVLTKDQANIIIPASIHQFTQNGKFQNQKGIFLDPKQALKYTISQNCHVSFSKGVQELKDYYGVASTILASAHLFNRKSQSHQLLKITIQKDIKSAYKILHLVQALIQSKQWANGRGDIEGSPIYFTLQAERLASQYGLKLIILKGEELLKQEMRLFHAVGRASNKEPTMINLSYRGNQNSQQWLAFIGKGICFDAGGLNLKTTPHLKPMFLDKSGSVSCLAAFQQIAKQKLKINVTVTMGMAQNFISSKSYRPSDIIVSKKGITVQIADTDAEGRLVLADCMTWTQQNFKVTKMIELSTLTYSCINALGNGYAGIFGNSESLNEQLKKSGAKVNEKGWILPLDQSHHEQLQSKVADCISDVNDGCPGASIAAAFLQKFVQQGVQWIHLDVAGVCIDLSLCQGTGYGARLLLQLARDLQKNQQKDK